MRCHQNVTVHKKHKYTTRPSTCIKKLCVCTVIMLHPFTMLLTLITAELQWDILRISNNGKCAKWTAVTAGNSETAMPACSCIVTNWSPRIHFPARSLFYTFKFFSNRSDWWVGKKKDICMYIYIYIYTGCNMRNGPDFGRVFLRSNYTDITQNTYIQSWTVTDILAREKSGPLWCLRTVLVSDIILPPTWTEFLCYR